MTPVRDWPTSGRIKIERAYQHIRDLDAGITAFRNRDPYPVTDEANTHGHIVHAIRPRESIPPCWVAIAADAVHNLHVALDHLWQRAINGPMHDQRGSFPAYPSPDKLNARFHGKETGRRKAALDILRSAHAFDVGNPFWDIRCFDNADKHDTMALVASFLGELHISPPPEVRPDEWQLPTTFSLANFERAEDGAVILTVAIDGRLSPVNMQEKVAFEITFGEGGVFERKAVLPTLDHLAKTVESLASAFLATGLLK